MTHRLRPMDRRGDGDGNGAEEKSVPTTTFALACTRRRCSLQTQTWTKGCHESSQELVPRKEGRNGLVDPTERNSNN